HTINEAESTKNLQQLINNWLERMPFFDAEFWSNHSTNHFTEHTFWFTYRNIYQDGLTEREATKIIDFDYVLFEQKPDDLSEEQLQYLRSNFSPKALRAALFIMLYRDFPVFQTSYQIVDALIEIDHLLSNWRHKHLIMVRRM
ncbi:tryptophan 2,3-dioxygenase, partial [Azoarcus indigens]|nr:tryptophan 2,3-dioxygenase [Azoarcus indigens]